MTPTKQERIAGMRRSLAVYASSARAHVAMADRLREMLAEEQRLADRAWDDYHELEVEIESLESNGED